MFELPLVITFVAITLLFCFIGRFYGFVRVDEIDPRYLISRSLRDTIPSYKTLLWQEENGFAGYDYVNHRWKSFEDMAGRLSFPGFNYYWDSDLSRWRKFLK